MPLEINFTLSDDDLKRFQEFVDAARQAEKKQQTPEQIEAAAIALLDEMQKGELPEYLAAHMRKLPIVIDMINDKEWQLSDEERKVVLSALAYLCDPEDLIPDHIPVLGYLDDAIYAEMVLAELRNEISLFEEFCAFRTAEESRRNADGEDVKVAREDWLREKRATLHDTMRKRRKARGGHSGWRMRLWS
jgi:uncharacterized membrane protein YkvA (DUF1232 family)